MVVIKTYFVSIFGVFLVNIFLCKVHFIWDQTLPDFA